MALTMFILLFNTVTCIICISSVYKSVQKDNLTEELGKLVEGLQLQVDCLTNKLNDKRAQPPPIFPIQNEI